MRGRASVNTDHLAVRSPSAFCAIILDFVGSLEKRVNLMDNLPSYSSRQQTISRFSQTDFLPDADLTKPEWKHAEKVVFDTSYLPGETFPESRTEVASLWTKTHLYFAFSSKYTELCTYVGEDASLERWGLWERDVVEVFINPFPERMNSYYEFEVAPNNQWVDLYIDLDKNPFCDMIWNSGFDHATSIDELNGLWCCEIRIPLSSLGANRIEPGMEWRINFYRCDRSGDAAHRRSLAWSPTTVANFHTPECFGLIRFEK